MDKSNASIKVNFDIDPCDMLDISPEQIVNLFIEVSQRTEKCFDFQISAWLQKYETLRKQPNFAEAALLIYAASQIYSRKLNFLEEMVYQLAANAKDKEENKDLDQTKTVCRKGKKLRNNTIVDSLGEAEFLIREFEHVPNVKFTELVQKKNEHFNSFWEKFKHSQCRFLKNKKNKLVISKKNKMDNSEIIAKNAGFGLNHIYDYDGEEVIGTKADFRCFSNILNENHQLVPDYNFTEYFQQVDLVNQTHKYQQELTSKIKDNIKFKFYVSNDYLKKSYGIELSENLNAEVECNLSTDINITEFTNSTSAKSSVTCDSAYQSMLSPEPKTSETNDFFSANLFEENTNKKLTEYNLAQISLQDTQISDNISLDEGISVRSSSIQSPISMSETGSEINLDIVFNHKSSLISHRLQEDLDQDIDVFFNKKNLFWIDCVYLEHKENFEIPINYLVQKVKLDINFLRLPDRKLKRKCIFALPSDDFQLRCTYVKLPVEPPNSRFSKCHLLRIKNINNSVDSNVESSDGEEFYGFEEEYLSEFDQNITETNTSTPNKRICYDASQKNKEIPLVDDSQSVFTDEEDIEKSKNDENLSTPERIRRINSARVSRDSGVISPEPNTLTMTMCDNESNIDVHCDLQHKASVITDQHQYQEQISYIQILIEKVNRWHQYLKPILKASEDRSTFDIHEYGTEVLQTFAKNCEQTTFANVMVNKPDDHFARYFLATLMLVNTGNLMLTNENKVANRVSDPTEIHLTLKSHERFYEETQNVPCIVQSNGTKIKKRKFEVDSTSIEFKKCKRNI